MNLYISSRKSVALPSLKELAEMSELSLYAATTENEQFRLRSSHLMHSFLRTTKDICESNERIVFSNR